MKWLYQKSFLFLFFFYFMVSCSSTKAIKEKKYLIVKEQGSFAVGGTIITNPGTFNPYKPTSEGQTFRGDHAYFFTKFLKRPESFRL